MAASTYLAVNTQDPALELPVLESTPTSTANLIPPSPTPPPPRQHRGPSSLAKSASQWVSQRWTGARQKGVPWVIRTFTWLNGGSPKQTPSVVVSRGWWKVVKKLLIHVVPVCATVALAVINITGFFIGSTLEGQSDPRSQAFYQLLLQVTAKLYELFIVASLTTIVWDMMRYQMLFGPEGLPLGFVSANLRLQDPTYWISPDFWFGQAGLGRRKRFKLVTVLVVCAMVALFAGPSSALLMFPNMVSDWRAGGASFVMRGDKQTLWPDELMEPLSFCNISVAGLGLQRLGARGCLPSSAFPISQMMNSWRFGGAGKVSNTIVEVSDGLVSRRIRMLRARSDVENPEGDTWAIAPHLASGIYSKSLMEIWEDPYMYPTDYDFTPPRRYKYRVRNGETVTIRKTQVPLVRVNCFDRELISNNQPFSGIAEPAGRYPVQPYDNETWPMDGIGWISPSPSLPFDTYFNSTNVTTLWHQIPSNRTVGIHLDADGNLVKGGGLSSAYMSVQIPYPDTNGTSGATFSCSIDARWAMGTTTGHNAGGFEGGDYFDANIPLDSPSGGDDSVNFPTDGNYVYLKLPGGLSNIQSRPVRLGEDWLNSLTPALDPAAPGYTSLASTIQALGFYDNDWFLNETISYWVAMRAVLASAIAATVADGMSYSGYAENGGGQGAWVEVNTITNIPFWDMDSMEALFFGTMVMGPNPEENRTTPPIEWTLTITGLVYKADSTAYYLALAVLFTHTLAAILHTAWTVRRRQTSTSWKQVTDVFALAANSQPTAELAGTSGGITDFAMFKKAVRIRDMKAIGRATSRAGVGVGAGVTGTATTATVTGAGGQPASLPIAAAVRRRSTTFYVENRLQLVVGARQEEEGTKVGRIDVDTAY